MFCPTLFHPAEHRMRIVSLRDSELRCRRSSLLTDIAALVVSVFARGGVEVSGLRQFVVPLLQEMSIETGKTWEKLR